ncbi:hypothetical protein GCM10023350_51950 [Nocardioides endophyticus]|uniref:Nuclear transport factor 2 family protein n=1 Tax=Nocardioides endophyticus TaxID=1353775 RepID=A0ABP8ZLL5_9ACTN
MKPADAMSDRLRRSLDTLSATRADEVAEVLEIAEALVFDEDLEALSGPDGDADFAGVPLAREFLDGDPGTPGELARLPAQVEFRWRLNGGSRARRLHRRLLTGRVVQATRSSAAPQIPELPAVGG